MGFSLQPYSLQHKTNTYSFWVKLLGHQDGLGEEGISRTILITGVWPRNPCKERREPTSKKKPSERLSYAKTQIVYLGLSFINFKVSGFALTHVELTSKTGEMGMESRSVFFMCAPGFPAPFAAETVFLPVYLHGMSTKSQVAEALGLYSIALLHISGLEPKWSSFCYYGSSG